MDAMNEMIIKLLALIQDVEIKTRQATPELLKTKFFSLNQVQKEFSRTSALKRLVMMQKERLLSLLMAFVYQHEPARHCLSYYI